MPLFQTKSKKKQQPVFTPEQHQTQSNTFQQPIQKAQKPKALNKKAVKADPLGALTEIIQEFDGRLTEAVSQLCTLNTVIGKLDELIEDDKTMLKSDNPQLVASVRANISCIQDARREHQKVMHDILKSLLEDEKTFVSKRLQIDKVLNADTHNSDEAKISDADWTAYEKQLHLNAKTKIVATLKNKKLSESISLLPELRLDDLQEEREKLDEENSGARETKQERIEKNEKRERTVASIRKQQESFMILSLSNNDPGFLRQIHQSVSKKDYTEFLTICHRLKDRIWDQDRGAQFLNPEYIITHMTECFTILGASNAMIKNYNSGNEKDRLVKSQINYLTKKKMDMHIPEAEARAAAEREAAETLDILKYTLEYFQKHINNVLAEYRLECLFKEYDSPYIAEKDPRQLTFIKRVHGLREEYDLYHTLLNAEANLANPVQNNPRIERNAGNTEEEKLIRLERQLGIEPDPTLSLRTANQQQAENQLPVNKDDSLKTGYFRLAKYTQDNYNNANYNIVKVKRMREIVRVLTEKFKEENNGQGSLLFHKVYEEFTSFVENMTQNDRLANPDHLWRKVRAQLKNIIVSSVDYKEKSYAGFLLDQLLQIGGGELHFQKEADYTADDAVFLDMYMEKRSSTTYTNEKGEESARMFVSAEDLPLFEHEPCLKDICQGRLGDCYFLAAIASIVVSNPDSIKKIIQDNLDGTVTVRFYNYTDNDQPAVYVKVDKSIPVAKYNSGRIEDLYASGPLWVKMLEKAYAVVRNNSRQQNKAGTDIPIGEEFWKKKETHDIKYENITGGYESIALQHLTGKTYEYNKEVTKITPIKGFDGRIDIGDNKGHLSTLPYLIFADHYKTNKKALDYLTSLQEGQPIPSEYEKAYADYKLLNDLMEQLLNLQEGEKTLQLMDSKTFKAAVQTVLAKLSTFKDRNGKLKDSELKNAGIPQEAIKSFGKCWKAYEQNGARFYETISKMIELFNTRYDTSLVQGEYTVKENELFQKIREKVHQKEGCTAGTKIFTTYSKKIKGKSGEKFQDGMYATHAYTIVGAEECPLNGVNRKWLVLYNPHGGSIPVYKLNENGSITRMPLKDTTLDADSYEKDTHGIFLMELRDAFTVINEVSFSK